MRPFIAGPESSGEVTAYEEGLLDVPSQGSMDAAAAKVGISRSTFGEHLRKATYQLVSNAYPFITPGSYE